MTSRAQTRRAGAVRCSTDRRIPRIIYNDDSCTLRTAPQPHTVKTLACALDYLKGTRVDCLCWCVCDQSAYSWPSKVIEPWRSLCREAGVLLYPAVEGGPAFNIADFYSPLIRNPLAPRHDGSGGVRFPENEKIRMKRAAAQNLLAQRPDGIAMFNFPCWLAEGKNIMHTDPVAFRRVTSLLSEMGSLKTLARKDKRYTFYKDLPIYVEAHRPRRFHQTIPFAIRGKDIRDATVTLRFRQIAEKNPHADGRFRQNPIVKPGLLKYYLNDREIAESELKKTKAPAGRIPSGFRLKRHEIVELQVSGRELRDGENTLAFEMPKFPHERDPYVYIYNLDVDLTFNAHGNKNG